MSLFDLLDDIAFNLSMAADDVASNLSMIADDVAFNLSMAADDAASAVDDATEIAKVVTEGVSELGELCTDGFVEMVIKGNDNYKTSYEKREEADNIVSFANGKLQTEQQHIQKTFESVDKIHMQLITRESTVVARLKGISFSSTPSIIREKISFSSCYEPYFDHTSFNFGTFLGGFIGIAIRKSASNQYMEDAKDYAVEVDGIIAKLHKVAAEVASVQAAMEEELRILDMVERLQSAHSFYDNSHILFLLNELISVPVCDQNGVLSIKYQMKINELKGVLK